MEASKEAWLAFFRGVLDILCETDNPCQNILPATTNSNINIKKSGNNNNQNGGNHGCKCKKYTTECNSPN
jgi:hypothetical protein